MNRREVIAALGAAGLAGCVGVQTDRDPTAGEATAETDGSDSGRESDDEQSIYAARADAVDRAGSVADEEAAGFGTYDGDGPETIAFPTTSGGTSATTRSDSTVAAADDVNVVPHGGDRVRFGGDVGRSLRVRNLATESALTFEPAAETEVYAASRIKINTDGRGTLHDATPTLYVPDREETTVDPAGAWSGDRDLFKHQTFATYVVELLEDGAVVGTTGGRVIGVGYRWAFAQTETAAFVTRHPSVREDWHVEFRVGGSPFDHDDAVTAAHRPDADVFEIDLTELDVDPGEYDWRLHVSESAGGDLHDRFIELRSVRDNTVVVR